MTRLHDDEIDVDAGLARRLIASQFPTWASLPLRPADSAGTANAIFRLGEDLSVRLPRAARFEEPETDCWLGALAGRLPLPIPEPVAGGDPGEGYPLRWSVHRWLPGEPWQLDRVEDACDAAATLAEFVCTLHALPPTTSCPPLWNGGTFHMYDGSVRAALGGAPGVDTGALAQAWDTAQELPPFTGDPVLIHWDLLPGNVLVHQGRISGVIDWGALAVGDPSRDLLPAWTLFDGPSRHAFRAAVGYDEPTWARGRAWALAFVVGVDYYADTNPRFAAQCRSTVAAALAETAA